ncbi:MAG TPA: hypothetical protein VHD83_09415 [Puia sp.]|nr:hypothetical protein [Puia sp.]
MYKVTRRRMKLLFPCVCVAILTLSSLSCKKGDPGTANVIFSDWFKPDIYTKDTVFGIWGYNYIRSAPDITQQLLDSGTVIVYGKLTGYNSLIWPAGQIAPLPINLTYIQGQTMTDTWSGQPSPGKIRIRFVNDKNYWTSISNEHMFRYIVIPGAAKARTASTTTTSGMVASRGKILDATTIQNVNSHWQHMSYEEVCNELNIPR